MTPAPMRDKRLPFTEIDEEFLPPRDPVLGYIKIGGKDQTIRYSRKDGSPWVRPASFIDPARFEVTTREKHTKRERGQKGSETAGETFTVDLGYVRDDAFHELEGVGAQPTALRVRLLYRHWRKNFIAFMGAYGGGDWVCRGNGVEAIDVDRGPCVCPCPRLKQFEGVYAGDHPDDGKSLYPCKPHAQFNVMLEDARVFGGFHAYKTTSYETIANLTSTLRMFEEMFERVDGLPLELRVMAASKQIPGGGRTTQPIVTLVLPASMDTARQVAADAAAESRKFLPAGRELDQEVYREAVVSEMEEEASAYAKEFLPGEEVPGEEVKEESGGGPSAEAGAGPEGQDNDETPSPDDAPQPKDELDGPTHEEDPDPEDIEEYELARRVLATAGWDEKSIADRLAYHRQEGTLGELVERTKHVKPEQEVEKKEAGPGKDLPF